jgi:hypothetical protein
MTYPHDMRVCPKEGYYTGETLKKLEDKIKGKIRADKYYQPLDLLQDDLAVETDCYFGKEPPAEGDGWCRDKKGYKGLNRC